MKRILDRVLVFVVAAGLGAVFAAPVAGQALQTGLNRWGSYQSFGPGTVNQGTLNNHLEFPIFNRRAVGGAQLNLRLSYDSQSWIETYDGWAPGNWGWKLAMTAGTVAEDEEITTCGWYGDPNWPFPGDDQAGEAISISYTVTEPDGTVVPSSLLPTFVWVSLPGSDFGYGNDCPADVGTPGNYPVADGKGYTLAVDEEYTGTLNDAGGDVVSGNYHPGYTDRNGNRVYATTSGTTVTYTDGLGTTAVTQTGSGTVASPLVYTYTGPGGTSPAVTEDFKSVSVTTDFGCAGHSEWSGTAVVPKDLVYPDGSSYVFDYDGAGRLTSVTLPTGGEITYAYTLDCTDLGNSALTLTNNVDSGEWSWARTQEGGGEVQTVQTDPLSNDTVSTYPAYSGAPSEVDSWSGNHSSGGIKMKTQSIVTTLSGSTVTEQNVTTGVYNSAGSTALYTLNKTAYDSFGNPTSVTSYDWSSSPSTPGTEVRQVVSSYTTVDGTIDQLNSVTVKDGGGTQVGKTAYSYDAYGNPTTVEEYTGASTYLSKSATYNTNGTVATAVDVNGQTTSYTYAAGSASCYGAFPTTVSDPMSLGTTMTWNCDGGVMLTQTDPNSQTTTYTYDETSDIWRPASIEDAATNTTTITYPTTTPYTAVERAMTFNSSSSTVDTLTTVDGLGRPILQQKRQGPSASDYDTVATTYDKLNRPVTVTEPYSATAGTTTGGTTAATTSYDALGRTTEVENADSGTLSEAYDRNDVLQTVGPAPDGESTKEKQLEYDGLGRLSSVCEVTGGTGSGNCGQTNSQTGYWTKYTYNPQGQITAVSQNAQSGTAQARSYGYDQLGRLTSETNPESGTVNYTFDSDGADACGGTYNGDLVKKTDAMGTADVTCYAYDYDHRLTAATYPSGTYASATPAKHFVYDTATVDSTSMANPKGRLVEAYTGSSGSKITDEGFSYTVLGQTAAVYQSSTNSGGWYVTSETYWANGAPETLSAPGVPEITYGVDGEGRPTTVGAASGQNPVTAATNTALGVTAVTLGSGDSDGYTYDTATGQMKTYTFTVDGVTDVGTLTWNPNGSLGKLVVADSISGTSDSQTCNYSHDDLGRLAGVDCGAGWSQTFSYDAYGNLTKSGTQSFGAAYANNDNRISTNVDFTPSYDANGNLTSDPVAATNGANAYDADGHAITLEGIGVTYDALGRAVEAAKTGGTIEFAYGTGGAKLAVMSGQTLQRAEILLPGGGTAVYDSSGLAYYRHADHLGSSRLASTPSQTLYSSTAYAPYGEAYDEAGTGDRNYTGMSQDVDNATSGGQYDFLMREQNPVQGRWWTPDPSGTGAVDPTNPQSWNRYAYVGGTPLSSVDPLGLSPITFMFYASGNCYCAPPQKPMSTDSYLDPSEWLWELDGGGLPLIQPSQPQPGSWGGGCPADSPDCQPTQPPAPEQTLPPSCSTGFGLGITLGADATAGLGDGAGANGSIGAGVFGGSNGLDAGAFASGSVGATGSGRGASIPGTNLIGRFFLGLVGGGGVGGFITNASQADQLQGLSGTWTVDLGSFINGAAQFSAGTDAAGNSIWSFSFTLGLGLGAGIQTLTNQTVTTGYRGGC